MKKMKRLSDEFVLAVSMLITSFIVFQIAIFPAYYGYQQRATVREAASNPYRIVPSREHPGAYVFNYSFAKVAAPKGERMVDFPINQFEDRRTGIKDLPRIRDAWNYPVRENAYMKLGRGATKAGEKRGGDDRSDEDPDVPGLVNCRNNESEDGYFKAYFEDVALGTAVAYDDPTYGEARRNEACQVLQDIAELIRLDQTDITPDILFSADTSGMPSGALAGASSYSDASSSDVPDNGTLNRHITTFHDPTPGMGNFDAYVLTNFTGVSWDVDSDLNSNTYDFYSVIYHEIMHALGFRSLLPAVIATTGDQHVHGTFDRFVFRDETLLQPFFDQTTGNLSVPTGAPSPWFTTDQVVYRGIANIVGAVPNGIRPVYSPESWEQGSSLSHFDMNRADGEVYVMHPSIGTNTERSIHADEKEVLCHLGYAVENSGIPDCEYWKPVANPDTLLLQPGTATCATPLNNDESLFGAPWVMHALTTLSLQPGDSITYYSSNGCTGSVLSGPMYSRSFVFAAATSSEPRTMLYDIFQTATGRVSDPAEIRLIACEVPDGEHVCNGDFEMSKLGYQFDEAFACPNGFDPGFNVPFWCGVYSPDLATDAEDSGGWTDLPFACDYFPAISAWSAYSGCSVDNGDDGHQTAFIYALNSGGLDTYEELVTELNEPLEAGEEYRLSFDYIGLEYHDPALSSYPAATLEAGLQDSLDGFDPMTHIDFDQTIFNGQPTVNDGAWHHVEQVFTSASDAEAFAMNVHYETMGSESTALYIDNVSIMPYDADAGTVTGEVYLDVNGNGVRDGGESGLDGIAVVLIPEGETEPVAEMTTLGNPDLGEYSFTGVVPGTYGVALADEEPFFAISQPGANGNVAGYDHGRVAVLAPGTIVSGQDFGVMFAESPVPSAEIRLDKRLVDGTLSVLDRNITWEITVWNAGPDDMEDIVIGDAIPSPLTYYAHTVPIGSTYDPAANKWSVPFLANGSHISMYLTTRVPIGSCGVKTNIVTLLALAGTDTVPETNTAQASIKIPCTVPPLMLK